ncbi:MAG TPA: hypothetical protein VGQ83_20225 [Polyangia bacterium]|jgi:hypothetical protein
MRLIKAPLVLCGCALVPLAPTFARAEAPAPTFTVELEVADRPARGAPDTLRLLFTISDRGCSSASARRDPVRYEVTVCREGGDASAPILGFTVERAENSREGNSLKKLRSTARVALGVRRTVGRFGFGDGSITEIAATVR